MRRLVKKRSSNLWVFLLLGLVVAGTLYFVGDDQGWWAAEVAPPADDDSTTPTSFTFQFYNVSGDILDGEDGNEQAYGYLYEYDYSDIDDFDQNDMNELAYADFTLAEPEIEHEDEIIPDADTAYICLVNCTGYTDYWFVPTLGDNDVTLWKVPTDKDITTISALGDATIVNTSEPIWYCDIFCTDADGVVSDDVGYPIVYDFTAMTAYEDIEDTLVYNVIVIDCNGTGIETSDVDIDGLLVEDIQVNSDKIEIYIDEPIYGHMEFTLEFDETDLGVDFEVQSVALARGFIGDSLTTLDTAP